MEKFEFPIKTKPACVYKWTWSTLFLSIGKSSSCHRCIEWDVSDNIHNFHNHPEKLEDRKKMLNGIWPGNGCEYCKKIEDVGGISERISLMQSDNLTPKELVTNPNEINVTPRILEVYFTNICNQKCVYCTPLFSSLIQKEVEKYGPLETEFYYDGFRPRDDYEKLKNDFWDWMEKNSRDLYHFQILGGEPMYQPEFEECLQYFERHTHSNTNWRIFSNLKHSPTKFKDKLERISKLIKDKKLLSFEIVCSMDCWGPQAEFSRYGMNLLEWEENFEILMDFPLVNILIHSTITPVTLPTMSEFYKKIIDWRKFRQVDFGWNTVVYPTFMNPEIIGNYAKPFFDELIPIIPDDDHRKKFIIGYEKQIINSVIDKEKIKRLYLYLDKIDIRRGTDWKKLYPYLVEIIKKENI